MVGKIAVPGGRYLTGPIHLERNKTRQEANEVGVEKIFPIRIQERRFPVKGLPPHKIFPRCHGPAKLSCKAF